MQAWWPREGNESGRSSGGGVAMKVSVTGRRRLWIHQTGSRRVSWCERTAAARDICPGAYGGCRFGRKSEYWWDRSPALRVQAVKWSSLNNNYRTRECFYTRWGGPRSRTGKFHGMRDSYLFRWIVMVGGICFLLESSFRRSSTSASVFGSPQCHRGMDFLIAVIDG